MSFDVTYDYNAFGDFYQPGNRTTKFAYTGQQYDAATGLYFLRARYYDPAIGRFLSQDPYPVNTVNPVELNRYVYTANNPVNFSDPSGLTFMERVVQTLPWLLLTALVVSAFSLTISIDATTEAIDEIEVPDFPSIDDIEDWFKGIGSGGSGGDPDDDGGGRGPRLDPIGAFGKIVKTITKFVRDNALVISAAVWIAGQVIKYVVPYVVPRVMPGEKIQPKPDPKKECDPQEDPNCADDPNVIAIWRGVGGNKKNGYWKNPSLKARDFRPRPGVDEDGLSLFEYAHLPPNSVTPYAYPFSVRIDGVKSPGITANLTEVPQCYATYTPQYGEGHWSVNCVGSIDTILSEFAEANRNQTILYPVFTGDFADDRRFDWP
ncbi:MAG: RHS repeat-associated core domain-containing protein [Chloroflexi bacterium]|nr:RHS repeat-associated core domain-containing protein [Chloroflexota bacterium]